MRNVLPLSLAIAVLAVGKAAVAEPAIADIAWLAGCWASDGGEAGSGEQWTSLAGATMLGSSRTVRQGRTVEYEFMALRHLADGKLAFIAHPSGQHMTVFPALRIGATEAVFENLAHDFPQRVVYARDGASGLRARIEGVRDGAPRVVEFPMRRTSCEAHAGGGTG